MGFDLPGDLALKQPVYCYYQSTCVRGERSSAERGTLPSIFGAGDLGSSSVFLHVRNGLEQTAGPSLLHLSGVEQSSCVRRAFSDVKAFRAGLGSLQLVLVGLSSVGCLGFSGGSVCTGMVRACEAGGVCWMLHAYCFSTLGQSLTTA